MHDCSNNNENNKDIFSFPVIPKTLVVTLSLSSSILRYDYIAPFIGMFWAIPMICLPCWNIRDVIYSLPGESPTHNSEHDDDDDIHSKREKVCGIAFSVKIFLGHSGSFWVILGPFWAIWGNIWTTLGHFGSFLGHFVAFLEKFAESSIFFAGS